MPPLITARSWRRFGEIAALVGIAGALWGPVGSAEAGVSAGSTATPKPVETIEAKPSPTGKAGGLLVGTGPGADQLQILGTQKAKRLGQQCSYTGYQTSFLAWLGNGFTSLAARSGPFTYCNPYNPEIKPWSIGESFQVTGWTDSGTNICRGSTYQTASSRWYRTSRGWVWSGGTSAPAWNRSC